MSQRIPQFQPQDAEGLAAEMLGQLNRAFAHAFSLSSTRDRVRRQREVFHFREARDQSDARHGSDVDRAGSDWE